MARKYLNEISISMTNTFRQRFMLHGVIVSIGISKIWNKMLNDLLKRMENEIWIIIMNNISCF